MKATLEAALQEFHSVYLIVETGMPGVDIPKYLKGTQTLQLGLNLPNPIRDLSLEDDQVCAGLSFGGQVYYCAIPYAAINAIRFSGRYPTKKKPERPSHLRLVK